MKVHEEIETLIDVYLAGGLEADERHSVEEHAASCAGCARILRDAKAFHGWMKGSSAAGAPPTGLEERIIANLRAATPGARRWPKARGLKVLAGIAAVFAFIVIGGLVSQSDGLAEVQNRLVASSGVQRLVQAGHDDHVRLYGYTDFSTLPSSQFSTWIGGESGKAVDEKYKADLQRNLSALNSLGIQSEVANVGGGGGAGYRGPVGGRLDDSRLKNADKAPAPAPATAAPTFADAGEESDREAFAAEKKSKGEGGEFERKDQSKGPEPKPGEPAPVVDDRKIIRNADLHLEVDKYDDAYKAISEITRAKKGFIAGASTTKLANGKIRATVTLRIPPELFEETLVDLGKLGLVRHQAISTADVTKQYQDLASRLKSKETLVDRLKKVLLEGKGTVKELMEVEVQMGATIEQIESIKGELKYYDNLVGLSTITMQVFEEDMGLPFEYVQTLQSVITVRASDADGAYAKAHKAILDAGGQVVDSRMTRTSEDTATGYVRGKVDSEKFPGVRKSLAALGHVDQDTV